MLILPKRSSLVKPPTGSQLMYGHPLSNGIAFAWLLNEGAGGIAIDKANRNNATFHSGATWTTGITGPTVRFDGGANGYLDTPATTVGASTQLSVAVRVWASTFAATMMFVEKEAVNAQWELFTDTSFLNLRGGGGGSTTTAPTPAAALWHSIVGVIDGTTGKIYVDGVLTGSGTVVALVDTSSVINLGRYTSGFQFIGLMDYAYVWKRALAASEAVQLHLDPYGMFAPPVYRKFLIPKAASASAVDHQLINAGLINRGLVNAGLTGVSE